MLRDRVAPALMYTLKRTQQERFHMRGRLEVPFVDITEQIFEDYKVMMRQAGADAYDLPSNEVIDDFWPFPNALVERKFAVLPSNPSKRLESPDTEREEAVSDDHSAVAPSAVSTRRSSRSRILTAKAREAISDASNSSLPTESAEEMPVPKDAFETFFVTSDNVVQAQHVQIDPVPKYRPNGTTHDNATYVLPDIENHGREMAEML